MDHQRADVEHANDKWTWFSLQLENGTDIMCAEYEVKGEKARLVDILDANGKSVYKSKTTKAEYPMSWKIEVPRKNIKLNARSTISDQEMIYGALN